MRAGLKKSCGFVCRDEEVWDGNRDPEPLLHSTKLVLSAAARNAWQALTWLWKWTWMSLGRNWAPVCFAAHSPLFNGPWLTLSVPNDVPFWEMGPGLIPLPPYSDGRRLEGAVRQEFSDSWPRDSRLILGQPFPVRGLSGILPLPVFPGDCWLSGPK